MKKMKHERIIRALILVVIFTGCGQKGPLFLDNTPDTPQPPGTPEETESQKDLKELEHQNQDQPDLTY